MAKTNDYRKSPISDDEKEYVAGEFTGAAEPEVDFDRGQKYGDDLEKSNPKFKAFMDKLRAAAKAITNAVCICFAMILVDRLRK